MMPVLKGLVRVQDDAAIGSGSCCPTNHQTALPILLRSNHSLQAPNQQLAPLQRPVALATPEGLPPRPAHKLVAAHAQAARIPAALLNIHRLHAIPAAQRPYADGTVQRRTEEQAPAGRTAPPVTVQVRPGHTKICPLLCPLIGRPPLAASECTGPPPSLNVQAGVSAETSHAEIVDPA